MKLSQLSDRTEEEGKPLAFPGLKIISPRVWVRQETRPFRQRQEEFEKRLRRSVNKRDRCQDRDFRLLLAPRFRTLLIIMAADLSIFSAAGKSSCQIPRGDLDNFTEKRVILPPVIAIIFSKLYS